MAKEIALIGSGNMGGAMLKGIVASGLVAGSDVVVTDVNEDKARALAEEIGAAGTTDNAQAVSGARYVFVAVKPQYLDGAAATFADALDADATVVSICAGVSLERLAGLFGADRKIVRVMPNLCAMVGEGMAALSPNKNVPDAVVAHVRELFEGFGRAEVVPEHLMDAVVGVSGSSPAYVAMFIEAMADAAVIEGMPRAQAYTFAEQAVLGTAKYLLETGVHPGAFKDMVSSPAGTTIAAVAELERGGFRATVIDGLLAAAERNRELG